MVTLESNNYLLFNTQRKLHSKLSIVANKPEVELKLAKDVKFKKKRILEILEQ